MFNKIVIVEPVLITEEGKEELKKYCKELVAFDTDVTSEEETISRIGDGDCILVSYKTYISKYIIENCKNLKHVALCCSFYGKKFAKVDIETLESKGVTYSHLAGHGDNGVIEFTVTQVINLIHGFYGKKWKEETLDLTNIKVGILGLGNLGSKIAKAFKVFESDVYYYSRTRKQDLEKELGITYLDLEELLETVDIISINVNRDVCLIGGDNLKKFGNGKIIVNSSIGKCYEINSLKEWLKNKNNYYICDKATINDDIKEILDYENVIYTNDIVGDTKQCFLRATQQIINNVKNASNELY